MSEGIISNRNAYIERDERRTGLGKILIALNVLLGVVILCELAFHFILAPFMILKNVVVESEISISNDEVLRLAGISGKEYYFTLDCAGIRKNLEISPLVRKAYIEKVFPDSLKVVLYGRKPTACAFVTIGNRSVPVAFDAEGVVFLTGKQALASSLPIISGFSMADATPGTKIPSEIMAFVENIERLRQTSPELYGLISEIRLVKRNDASYEALLYPINHRVPVRIGSEINEQLFRYIMMVLDVMEKERLIGKMDEIDFRTGEVVYRTRED